MVRSASAFGDLVQDVARRELDLPQRQDLERPTTLLLGDARVVAELELGVEAAGEHSLVIVHEGVADPYISEAKARQGREVAVGLRIETRGDDVDHADCPAVARPRLEQLLLAGTDRALGELLLNQSDALVDLRRVGAGAVATEHELDDIGRYRELASEPADQILAHEVSRKRLRSLLIQFVELHRAHSFPTRNPMLVTTVPSSSKTTKQASCPSNRSETSIEVRPSSSRTRPPLARLFPDVPLPSRKSA